MLLETEEIALLDMNPSKLPNLSINLGNGVDAREGMLLETEEIALLDINPPKLIYLLI